MYFCNFWNKLVLLRVSGCVVFLSIEESNRSRPAFIIQVHMQCRKCTFASLYTFTVTQVFRFRLE